MLVRPWAEAFHRRVALALGLTALVEAANAALLFVPSDADLLRQAALSFEFLRMAALFLVGAALIGHSTAEADPAVQRRSWIAVAVAVFGVAGIAWWGCVRGHRRDGRGSRAGSAADRTGACCTSCCCWGWCSRLAQLESVLRASRDPLRFRIKFVILGLCALAGFELYMTSQTLLLGAWRAAPRGCSRASRRSCPWVSWHSASAACGSRGRSGGCRCRRRRSTARSRCSASGSTCWAWGCSARRCGSRAARSASAPPSSPCSW